VASKRKDNYLLSRLAGWRAAVLSHVTLNPASGLGLRSIPGVGRPLADEAGTFGGLSLPTSIAVAGDGLIYILDSAAHALKRYDPCAESFTTLPCLGGQGPAPRQFSGPHGIAISRRNDLYVADTGNYRVQVFALKGLPLRCTWGPYEVSINGSVSVKPTAPSWPEPVKDCLPTPQFSERTWIPWDIALSRCGRVYVSDYANGVIHVFDPRGWWLLAFTGESPDSPPLAKPTHLAMDRNDLLYVIQEGKNFVVVFDADGKFLKRVEWPDDVRGDFCPSKIGVDPKGNIYLADRVRVYRVNSEGPALECCCAEPVSGFHGDCTSIAFDLHGQPLLGDGLHGCVTLLPDKMAYDTEGRYVSEALDSAIYQCRWHRVILHAEVPPGTQVQLDTFTSESLKTATEIDGLSEPRWATKQICTQTSCGTWDCLVTSPPGRFLWMRLTLRGDGVATPLVRSARVYCPRSSSLQYLPAVFSEEPAGADFLGRFLSIFDTLRGETNDLVTNLAAYFDPRATPAAAPATGQNDFLGWLASWLGLALDRHWPEAKRRELVRQAHRLYNLRGTAEGLRLHVKLYTGLEPRVLEHFQLRRWLYLSHGRLGDQSALFGAAIASRLQLDEYSRVGTFQLMDSGDPLHDPFHHYAHQFTVFVPVGKPCTEVGRQTLERIVNLAKPAHTLARIKIIQPRFRVGTESFIGLDTVLARYPERVEAGRANLGYDTLLGPSEDEAHPPTLRIGKRSRIGSNTLMD
jgi:phage tail-like protein